MPKAASRLRHGCVGGDEMDSGEMRLLRSRHPAWYHNRMESVDRRLTAGNYGRIARRANVTKQHVARVLKGKSGISLKYAFAISMAAGVTLDELYEFIDRQKKAVA